MKNRFRSVLHIFLKIDQNSCTIDHGYVTDYDILFSALKAENAHREALQESHQNTMSMFFKAFHSMN